CARGTGAILVYFDHW
nr:immunoglobulin heavy chain junction region [Macaca mulatta]MOX59682.1 immunoglobulin heavy chain junction region [Macaca mulatta]MOX62135.1 immunoglobulin heavy chain junction region [Macaca mulatta]MOX62177.1 immunoglobulin heavy chain junction region [Macaca mulatta]MOX68717.1 immunoglobulin heavy chain junction region [Macaca mulatta]